MGLTRKALLGFVLTAVVAAVVVIVVVFLNKPGDYPQKTPERGPVSSFPRVSAIEVDQLSSGSFMPGAKVRSLSRINDNLFKEAKDAAINEFVSRVKLVEGRYRFEPAEDSMGQVLVRVGGSAGAKQRTARIGGSVGVRLRIVDAGGKPLKDFSSIDTLTKETSGVPPGSIQAWLITFPSRNLYRVDMTKDSIETVWKPEMGQELCVTFTYKMGDGYKAALGQFHDFENQSQP